MRKIHRVCAPAIATALLLTSGAAGDGNAVDSTRTLTTSGDGSATVRTAAPAAARRATTTAPGAGGLLWGRGLSDALYDTAGLLMPAERLAAGTGLNPPEQVEAHDIDGTGVPAWMFAGDENEVATGRHSDVIAAIDRGTMTVRVFRAGSDVPEWDYAIESASPGTFRTLVVSPDGSTVAAIVTHQGGGKGNNASLYVFDADDGTPRSIFDMPVGTFGRNIAISDDGAHIAMMAGANVYVFDRDADDLRYGASAGASNDALAISGDGTYLLYGWTSLFVRRWDGTTYAFAWSRPGSGYTLALCAASSDGDELVATWRRSDTLRNRIQLFGPGSSTPVWTYDYDTGSGAYQDTPSDVVVTGDGTHIAVASWGDQANSNDEVHVFARTGPTPIFSFDTPGSMFAIDAARSPGGTLTVVACGKRVHANQTGRGGDLYALRVDVACPADLDGDGEVGVPDLLAVLAAWGPCPGCPEDLDDDGMVGASDLLAVLSAWAPCP
jgi:hypothetical protein